MVEKELYLHLPDQLGYELIPLNLRLLEHFHGAEKVGAFLLHQEHLTELALPQLLDQQEVLCAEFMLLMRLLVGHAMSVTCQA